MRRRGHLHRFLHGQAPEYRKIPPRVARPSPGSERSVSGGSDDARVTFLGHSTVLIEIDGLRVLTDPILRRRVGPLKRAALTPNDEHLAEIDAVLISHTHWDHLDYGSLSMIGRETPLLVPRGLAGQARGKGFHDIVELDAEEEHIIGGVRIQATEAKHEGFGPPLGATKKSLGFMLEGSRRIYFAGDTAYFEEMAELETGIDLALMPVWGWGPTAHPSLHLDPTGAALATALIRPRFAVPIHWGALHPVGLRRLLPRTRIDPPHHYAELVRWYAADTKARVLPVGASLTISSRG